MKDYYYILGINDNATENEIRTAYRKLSHKYHPDKNNNDPYFYKLFIEITESYNTLIDSREKRAYDEKRKLYWTCRPN